MTKKITFDTDEYGENIIIDLDDFIWLITNLYYMCNAVGCIPSMSSIDDANRVLNVIMENNLNTYIDGDVE